MVMSTEARQSNNVFEKLVSKTEADASVSKYKNGLAAHVSIQYTRYLCLPVARTRHTLSVHTILAIYLSHGDHQKGVFIEPHTPM